MVETINVAPDYWMKRQKEVADKKLSKMNIFERGASALGMEPEEVGSMAQRIAAEEVPAVAGARLGGQLAAPTGPWGRIAGMGLGAGFGALTGKRLDELMGNVRPDEQGLVNDLITAAGGSLAGKIPKPTSLESKMVSNVFEGRKIPVTPGLISDNHLVQAFEQRLRELPFSRGSIEGHYEKIYKEYMNMVDYLTNDATLNLIDPSDVGKAVQAGARKKIDAFQERAKVLFKATNIIARDRQVQPDAFGEWLLQYKGRFDNPELASIRDNPTINKIFNAMTREGEIQPQTWGDLDQVRHTLGELMQGGSGENLGLMKQAYKAVVADMDRAAGGLGGKERRVWTKAKEYYKRAVLERSEQLAKVEALEPERIWAGISAGKGNYTRIAKIKHAVDKDTWKAIQEKIVRDMGRDVNDNSVEFFNPRKFLREYSNKTVDSRAAGVLFGDMKKDLDALAIMSRRMRTPGRLGNPSGTAQALWIDRILLGAAGGGALYDPMAAAIGAGGLILLPKVLGKIWTSKPLLKWMRKRSDIDFSSAKQHSAWVRAGAVLMAAEGIDDPEIKQMSRYLLGDPPGSDIPSVPGVSQ
jgi:hypothetical protein